MSDFFTRDTHVLVMKGRHVSRSVLFFFRIKTKWFWWFFFWAKERASERAERKRERRETTPFARREMVWLSVLILLTTPKVSFLDEKRPELPFFSYILGTLFRFARIKYIRRRRARENDEESAPEPRRMIKTTHLGILRSNATRFYYGGGRIQRADGLLLCDVM